MWTATHLGNGTRVLALDDGETRVTLPNGNVVSGSPQGEPETFDPGQLETAHRLGYGADVRAMVRDHDPLHAALTDWLGMPVSYSLAEAAGCGEPADADLAEAEEHAVLAVQRLMRLSGRTIHDLLG